MTEICCKTVYSGSGGFGVHRCGNAAKVQRNSLWYCGTHDPVKVAQRKAKRQAEWDEQNKAHRRLWRLHSAAQAMYDALEAVNRYRHLENGIADLFHIVVHNENGKQVCVGDLIEGALAKARGEAR